MSVARWAWAVLIAAGAIAAGCADPVRDDALDELGPEADGVPAGPMHRAGQRCVGPCHDGTGPGAWVFSLAGTVYGVKGHDDPLVGARVVIEDAQKRRYKTGTNCAGNFFIQADDFTPEYPIWVAIRYGDLVQPMTSRIYREGSCAFCHSDPAGRSSAGRVFLFEEAPAGGLPKQECP